MLGPRGDLGFVLRLKQMMSGVMYGKLPQMQQDENLMTVPRDYLIAYMSSANVGILQHWLQTGMQESTKELTRMMTKLVNFGPLGSAGIRKTPAKP
ncbi:MAG: TetR family transcriptional regulator [Cohnella sp.]|jgi:hypothetical protein|nr:TetR family transcriptional regulator [Cohnella sp.]